EGRCVVPARSSAHHLSCSTAILGSCQAEIPLIRLSRFSRPPLSEVSQVPTRSFRTLCGLRPRQGVSASHCGAAHIAFDGGDHLGPCSVSISRLNPTPRSLTVYASPWSSPSTAQHSLPGGRYPLPGPDFHRLDRASFAWRTTTTPSTWRTLSGRGAGRPAPP